MVGVLGEFSSSTVASIGWTATCGFMVTGFANSKGRYMSDSVVDSHELGVLCELGDDFTRTHPLNLACYHGDRHEALFGGGVHLVGDFVESLCEVMYGESFTETSALFVSLPVALMLGVFVVIGSMCGCIGRQLVYSDIFVVPVRSGS
jgi:hypothetical protein